MDALQVAPPPTDEALLDFDSLFGVAHASAAARTSRPVYAPVSSAAHAAAPAAVQPAANNPLPVLELRAGAPTPTLHFGDVVPRASLMRTLIVRNDASRAQRVEVKGIESRDALRMYPMAMELEPDSTRELTVSWAPTSAGVVLAKKLELVMNGASSLELCLRGLCARTGGAHPHNTKPSAPPAAAAMSATLAMATPSNVTVRVNKAATGADDATASPRTPLRPNPNRGSANHIAAPPPTQPPDASTAKSSNFRAFLAERRAVVPLSETNATQPTLCKPAASAGPAEASGADFVGGFYDEAWHKKRSSAYEQWINFALSEPSMSSEGGGVGVLDARERQRLSLRELQEQINEAAYRRRMALLLREPALRSSLRKIEQQVQEGVICVRPSVNLAADVRIGNRSNQEPRARSHSALT